MHALVGLYSRRFIPYEKNLYPAIVLGTLFPHIDMLFSSIISIYFPILQSIEIVHRKFTHSFFTVILIYIFFAIISEIKKDKLYRTIGKGLALGIMMHIIIDTILWYEGIYFLWPLPVSNSIYGHLMIYQ